MSFSEALIMLKNSYYVTREGWNGKNMYIALQSPDENSFMDLPYLFIFTADGKRVPWLASQTDILANDWAVL